LKELTRKGKEGLSIVISIADKRRIIGISETRRGIFFNKRIGTGFIAMRILRRGLRSIQRQLDIHI
jgi:hypothetical protein